MPKNRTVAAAIAFVSLLWSGEAGANTLLGVYYGSQGYDMTSVSRMETWQGKKNAVLTLFTNWCNRTKEMNNLFNLQLTAIWNNRNVPLVTWEPFLCNAAQTPADVEVRAANGVYDGYFDAWSTRLKTWLSGPDGLYGTGDDRRLYLRPGHEMNGDWYPWGAAMGGNSPADFVAMWHHIRQIFAAKGIDSTHVQWVWAVNADDVGGYPAEWFYPGDGAVDWVAIDGYNWGATQSWSVWESPAQAFDDMVGRVRALTGKPLGLTELASTTSTTAGPSVAMKSQWISDLFAYLALKDVRLVTWFNEDKETDWAVFGGGSGDSTFIVSRTTYKTYSAYKSAVGGSTLVTSNASNPRLLTDAQFAGQP